MARAFVGFGLLFGAAISIGASLPAGAAEEGEGLDLAREHCARCHAVAEGETGAHAAAPPFTEIVTRYPPSALAEALAEGIVTGHPDMPEFVFPPEQIEALIVYLESLQR